MAILEPVKRGKSLTDQALQAIRAKIVSGQWRLGEALSEIAIAAELGVSKTPVREALLHLKWEGLVEIQPQKGTFVFRMTAEQVTQLSEIREILELGALRLALQHAPDALGETLARIVDRMRRALDHADSVAYRTLDGDLHQGIVDCSGNLFLSEAYAGIAFRVQALRNRLSVDAQLNQSSLIEHGELARMIRAADGAGAEALLRAHIRATRSHYIAVLAE